MQIGKVVVLAEGVMGFEADREARIMGMRDNMLMVGCRSRDCLPVVMAHTWEVLARSFSAVCARGKGDFNE